MRLRWRVVADTPVELALFSKRTVVDKVGQTSIRTGGLQLHVVLIVLVHILRIQILRKIIRSMVVSGEDGLPSPDGGGVNMEEDAPQQQQQQQQHTYRDNNRHNNGTEGQGNTSVGHGKAVKDRRYGRNRSSPYKRDKNAGMLETHGGGGRSGPGGTRIDEEMKHVNPGLFGSVMSVAKTPIRAAAGLMNKVCLHVVAVLCVVRDDDDGAAGGDFVDVYAGRIFCIAAVGEKTEWGNKRWNRVGG